MVLPLRLLRRASRLLPLLVLCSVAVLLVGTVVLRRRDVSARLALRLQRLDGATALSSAGTPRQPDDDDEEEDAQARAFATDWIAIYRVAVLGGPNPGVTPNYYSRLRLALEWTLSLQWETPTVRTLQRVHGTVGARLYASKGGSAAAWIWAPRVWVNASAVRTAPAAATTSTAGLHAVDARWLVAERDAPPCNSNTETAQRSFMLEDVHLAAPLDVLAPNVVLKPWSVCDPVLAARTEALVVQPASPTVAAMVARTQPASLLHAVADWFSVVDALELVVSESGGSHPDQPIQIVFLDDHGVGPLDGTWATLFGVPPLTLTAATTAGLAWRHVLLVSSSPSSPVIRSAAGTWGDGGPAPGDRSPVVERFAEFLLLRHRLSSLNARDVHRVAARALRWPQAAAPAPMARRRTAAPSPTPSWMTVLLPIAAEHDADRGGEYAAALADVAGAFAQPASASTPALTVHGVHLPLLSVRERLAVFRSSTVVVCIDCDSDSDALALALVMRHGSLVVNVPYLSGEGGEEGSERAGGGVGVYRAGGGVGGHDYRNFLSAAGIVYVDAAASMRRQQDGAQHQRRALVQAITEALEHLHM